MNPKQTLNEAIDEARVQAAGAAKVDPVACATYYLGLVMERLYRGGLVDLEEGKRNEQF